MGAHLGMLLSPFLNVSGPDPLTESQIAWASPPQDISRKELLAPPGRSHESFDLQPPRISDQ
jgi:hypothetical protein